MSVDLLEPVPWSFTDSPGVLAWTWLTPHFVARVSGSEPEADAEEETDGRRNV